MEPRHTVTSILRPVYCPGEKSPVTRLHSFFWKLLFLRREAPVWDFRAKPACLTCFHPCFRPFVWLRALSLIQAAFHHFFLCTTLMMRPLFRVLSLRFLHSLRESRCVFFCSYIRPGWISNVVNSRLVDPANTKNFQSQQNLQSDVAVIINFSHYELTDTVSVLSNSKLNHRLWNLEHWTLKSNFINCSDIYKLLYLNVDEILI